MIGLSKNFKRFCYIKVRISNDMLELKFVMLDVSGKDMGRK